MLEHSTLLVRPRDGAARQAVVDPETGVPLGHAAWRPGRDRRWWLLPGPLLTVHEHEDEPLLFSVRRGWGPFPWREVHDAEGGLVGVLLRSGVRDRWGRVLAVLHAEGPHAWSLRGRDGPELAAVTALPAGVRLAFAPAVEGDPFAKMLLLAAVLGLAAGVRLPAAGAREGR